MYVIQNKETMYYWLGFSGWVESISNAFIYKTLDNAVLRSKELTERYGMCEVVQKKKLTFNTNLGVLS